MLSGEEEEDDDGEDDVGEKVGSMGIMSGRASMSIPVMYLR
ncbi:hypothetical protein FACS189472_12010 [Alphaproteobacteria bacterium]|nr:hypothetical protein FACS189472_12010 [Alphaproteobacteria bacterium]